MTEQPPLPKYWEIRECKDYPGRCYFYNPITNESTWVRPGDPNPKMIYVAQILIKTEKSIKPETKNGPVTRTVEEAFNMLKEIRDELETNKSKFSTIANQVSDMDEKTGGVLGWIRYQDVPPEFAEAAWKLKLNELSDIIQTPLGVHLILRLQ